MDNQPSGMKVLCIKTYKTEIDILDLPKVEHTAFKEGRFYEMFLIDRDVQFTAANQDQEGYYVEGEDKVSVTFSHAGFNKHFVVGTSNIRNAKLAMVGILD